MSIHHHMAKKLKQASMYYHCLTEVPGMEIATYFCISLFINTVIYY